MDEQFKSDVSADQTEETGGTEETRQTQEPLQDPIQEELEKVKRKGEGKTELERAIFKKQQIEKRIAELGGDSGDVESDFDEDKPVTVKMLREMEEQKAQKTSLQLAEEIENEHERELTKYYLSNTIKSSGNPSEDYKMARALVNSKKNSQIAEEIARRPVAKQFSSATSGATRYEGEFTPTEEEARLMKWGGLTKEEVIASRKAE